MSRKIAILGERWCTTCNNIYNKLSDELGREYVDYIDLEIYPHIFSRFKISAYPTIAFIDNNEIKHIKVSIDVDEIATDFKFIDSLSLEKDVFRCVLKGGGNNIDSKLILKITSKIEKNFDWVSGGLNTDIKRFPFDVAEFLFKMYIDTGVEGYLKMVHKTIDIVLQSRIFNYREYILSRISYSPDWDDPDNVYLLKDQARFIKILSYLYSLTGNDIYINVASNMVKTILKKFLVNGKFYTALVEDKPTSEAYPHTIYSTLLDLGYASIYHDINRYTVNLIPFFKRYESTLRMRGFDYILDDLLVGMSSMRFYEVFKWKPGLDIAKYIFDKLDGYRVNSLYKDIVKSVYKPFDSWRCIPYLENIVASDFLYRLGVHMNRDDLIKDSREILGKIDVSDIDDINLLSYFGLVASYHVHGLDKIVIYGYNKMPRRLGEVVKPYTIITYMDSGERYIEYISRNYSFKL